MKLEDLRLGCDPEVFLYDRVSGEMVGAYDRVPGTKYSPHLLDRGMVQVDGMACEFGIDPSATREEFIGNIDVVMGQIRRMLPTDCEIRIQPVVVFSEEEFDRQPLECQELGCEPDFNAWLRAVNPRPRPPVRTMRSAGGHVHLGWSDAVDFTDPSVTEFIERLVKNLDWTLLLKSMEWDSDNTRRKLYGKPGTFRPKPYGMEYRPLSCMWLETPDLQGLVFDITQAVFRATIEGLEPPSRPPRLNGKETRIELPNYLQRLMDV